MRGQPLALIQGTLDLLVLKTLAGRPMHGYGIAVAIADRTGGELAVEDAALYQALHRLERRALVAAEWDRTENNRRARFYTLTAEGRRRLHADTAEWRRYAQAVFSVLDGA
jgi:PadR family transcriptional regulator PadR